MISCFVQSQYYIFIYCSFVKDNVILGMHNFPLQFTIYRRQGRFEWKEIIKSCPLLQMYLVYYTKENV